MQIDVHAHVFNADDLPIRGFLRHRGVPEALAELVEEIIQSSTDPGFRAGLAAPMAATVSDAELLEAILARRPDLRAALRGQLLPPTVPGVQTLALIEWPALVYRFVSWARLLTKSHVEIAARLMSTYSKIDLFPPLMMDIGDWVGEQPPTSVPDQIAGMGQLIARPEIAGRMHPFVAFDPLRNDGLALVRGAISSGFIGVKLYPPLGYRPIGNAGPNGATIDQRLEDLYAFCEAEDVPIVAHCTRHGAEVDHHGIFADPDHWRPVLERHRSLRLDLAHFGSMEELLGPPYDDTPDPWPPKIVALMGDFSNVYVDVSYFDEIADRDAAAACMQKLATLYASNPAIARRVMYGSDWHMIMWAPAVDDYYRNFVAAYGPQFPSGLADFLGGNAERFLGLIAGAKAVQRLHVYYERNNFTKPAWLAGLSPA